MMRNFTGKWAVKTAGARVRSLEIGGRLRLLFCITPNSGGLFSTLRASQGPRLDSRDAPFQCGQDAQDCAWMRAETHKQRPSICPACGGPAGSGSRAQHTGRPSPPFATRRTPRLSAESTKKTPRSCAHTGKNDSRPPLVHMQRAVQQQLGRVRSRLRT